MTDSHMRELIAGGYDIFKIYSSLDTKFLRSKDRKISLGLAKTSSIKNVIESADALVINAEGSIHHAGGRDLLAVAELAQAMDTPVYLVNAVMQEVDGYDDVLQNCTDITVREQKSLEYLRNKKIDCRMVLDSILDANFSDTPHKSLAGKKAYTDWQAQRDADVGKTTLAYIDHHPNHAYEFVPFSHWSYPIDRQWAHSVANFKDMDLLITGRHHAVYVAGMAGATFVAMPSNTHKIEGTIACSGLPIPICDNYIDLEKSIDFAKNNPNIYKDFQSFLMSHQGLDTFAKLKADLPSTTESNIAPALDNIMSDLQNRSFAFSMDQTLAESKVRIRNKKILSEKQEKALEVRTLKNLIEKIVYDENIIDTPNARDAMRQANLHIAEDEFDDAKRLMENCVKDDPNDRAALYTLGRIDIHQGNTQTGLETLHHRSHLNVYYPKTSFHAGTKIWDGEPTKEKVLIWSSLGPGIGTEVFLYSLLPHIIEAQRNLLIMCDPRLLETMRRTFPKAKFCGYTDIGENGRNLIKHQCSLWSLPNLYFKHSQKTALPDLASYLKVDHVKCDALKSKYKTKGKKTIGVSWHTPNPKTAHKRTLDDDLLVKMTRNENANFVSLQHGAEDLDVYGHESIIFDESINPVLDLDGLIHQIAAMDAVVTIDNSVAYIAGALGIPTYVLVPYRRLWTWKVIDAYPEYFSAIKTVQQGKEGEWDACLDEIMTALDLI